MENKSHNRFLALFEQSALPIQIYNSDGFCVAVNEAWEGLFDTTKDNLEGYNVLEDPQVHELGVIDFFRRAFAGEIVYAPTKYFDPELSGKKGRARWLDSIFSPVRYDSGNVLEVAILYRDVTEGKSAEQELQASRDQLKVIFETVAEGIFAQNASLKCVFANMMAARMAGYNSPEEWINSAAIPPHLEILSEDGQPFPLENLPARKIFAGDLAPKEISIRFRNNQTGVEKISSVLTRPVFDSSGKPYLAVSAFRDITDQKLMQENLIRSINERDEALHAKDLFFSVASHELRTPLTSLKLQLHILEKGYEDVREQTFRRANRQIDKLNRLVEDLLDISRISAGKLRLRKEKSDLGLLVKEVFEGLKGELTEAGITCRYNLQENVIGLWDSDRIEQVIENLVTNTIKYAGQTPAEVRVFQENGNAILELRDYGPGIKRSDIGKIFDLFETSDASEKVSGIGLGLHIVKELTEHHGGSVTVQNCPDGGTLFRVSLPLSF